MRQIRLLVALTVVVAALVVPSTASAFGAQYLGVMGGYKTYRSGTCSAWGAGYSCPAYQTYDVRSGCNKITRQRTGRAYYRTYTSLGSFTASTAFRDWIIGYRIYC